jgi:hypothetical protein
MRDHRLLRELLSIIAMREFPSMKPNTLLEMPLAPDMS